MVEADHRPVLFLFSSVSEQQRWLASSDCCDIKNTAGMYDCMYVCSNAHALPWQRMRKRKPQ
jgi:hypothetical protein